MDVTARASIAAAVAARDLSDSARAVVTAITDGWAPGELATLARRARTESLAVLDRVVLAEVAAGATWAEVADAIRVPVEEVIARYQPVLDRWVLAGIDPDPRASHASIAVDASTVGADDARAVDAWCARHTDPWEPGPRARLVDRIA